MSKILTLRQNRGDLWDKAKAFLNEHQDENGNMSAEDTAQYERMEQEIVDMGHAIERMERAEQMDKEMNAAAREMLVSKPEHSDTLPEKPSRGTNAYARAFWNQMRGRATYEVMDALQIGELSEGGYTVPDEFDHQLVKGLEDENIMRGLVHIIRTGSGQHKIPIMASHGTGAWVEEEQQIPESDDSFTQVTLSAHKFATMIRVSRELLNDSAFDIAGYIANEFVRRAGAAEEDAIINGDGAHKPVGLLHPTLGAQIGLTTTSSAAVTTDNLFDLQHSLRPAYRRKACFIMNDATLADLRKLKDGAGQYIWRTGLTDGAPDTLFNQKVLVTNSMPLISAGSKAILYGDFSYYWLAEREGRSLERLNELYAVTDQIGFKMTERLDGRLILPEAVKALQMKP